MPTTKTRTYAAALADYSLFAPIGAGQLLLEKARELSTTVGQAAMAKRADVLGAYRDLATRGRSFVGGLRKAPAARRVEARIDAARIQLRDPAATAKRRPRATTKRRPRATTKAR